MDQSDRTNGVHQPASFSAPDTRTVEEREKETPSRSHRHVAPGVDRRITPWLPSASLRSRLIVLVLWVVLPGLALAVFTGVEARYLTKAQVHSESRRLVQLAALGQEQLFESARQLLSVVVQLPPIRGNQPANASLFFANLLKLYTNYSNFGMASSNGVVVASGIPLEDEVDLANRSWFQHAVRSRDFAVGDYQIGTLTKKPTINFGHPVLDTNGQVQSVVFAALDLSLLNQAAVKAQLPKGTALMVIDRNGTLIARYPTLPNQIGRTLADAAIVQAVMNQQEGVAELAGIDGVQRLYAFTSIRGTDGPSAFVCVGIPESLAFASANRVFFRNVAILICVSIAAVFGAKIYAERSILKRVNTLVTVAGQLKEGNLAGRTGLPHGVDEFGRLAQGFDEMADRLQEREAEARRADKKIRELNQDLERRVAERTAQLETTNKELEAFSYSVSHDLRAPLRHIGGFAKLLRDHAASRLDEQGARYLNTITDCAKKMGVLIDDLLAFSRMGRMELRKTDVDLEALVEEVIRGLQLETLGRNIQWKRHPLPQVRADLGMLRQALANLLSNAVKYTRPRNPAQIEIGCAPGSDSEVVLFVKDNGVGFAMEFAGKLFGVFQRLHRADEFEGTGIGLANVARILHRHGGRVWAEAAVDQGATFYFALPAAGSHSSLHHERTQTHLTGRG